MIIKQWYFKILFIIKRLNKNDNVSDFAHPYELCLLIFK